MGTKRDGVDKTVEWAKHGIRHRGRGVREAEARLIQAEADGTADVPKHRKKRGSKPWQLQYKVGNDWETYSLRSYGSVNSVRRAAEYEARQGFWKWLGLGGPTVRNHPTELRARNKKTGEVREL